MNTHEERILNELHEALNTFTADLAEDIGFGRKEGNQFFAEVYGLDGEVVSTTTFTVEFS